MSPGIKKARRNLKKAAIQLTARDVITLKLAGMTYGAISKIICRYKEHNIVGGDGDVRNLAGTKKDFLEDLRAPELHASSLLN